MFNSKDPIIKLWPELVGAVNAGALATADSIGDGDKDNSDHLAVEAINAVMAEIEMDGRVVIGEGERDKAPMLYIGQKVGTGTGPKVSIAIDPLEGTKPCAKGQRGAICILACAEAGGIIGAADGYMDKLAVGPDLADVVQPTASIAENIDAMAQRLDRETRGITIAVLDRMRNQAAIDDIRKSRARVTLITDGDLSEVINAMVAGHETDAVMGSGGSPEGHIGACVAKCMGGAHWGRYLHPDELAEFPKDRGKLPDNYCDRMREMGIEFGRYYTTDELAPGQRIVVAIAHVTHGVLRGEAVKRFSHGHVIHWSAMGCEDGIRHLIPPSRIVTIDHPKKAFRL